MHGMATTVVYIIRPSVEMLVVISVYHPRTLEKYQQLYGIPGWLGIKGLPSMLASCAVAMSSIY